MERRRERDSEEGERSRKRDSKGGREGGREERKTEVYSIYLYPQC